MGFIVLLENDIGVVSDLFNTISSYYIANGRVFVIFDNAQISDELSLGYYVRFLVDRRCVVEYKFERDRQMLIGTVSLGIGPAYFPPANFWDYENSKRFSLEASIEAINLNLAVLD